MTKRKERTAAELINELNAQLRERQEELARLEAESRRGRTYPERVREGIARALAVPHAIGEWATLRRLFESEQDVTTTGVKWALACALAAAATDDVLDDLTHLLQDRRNGANRVALISALAKSTDPRCRRALQEACSDPELAAEAQRVLRRLNSARRRKQLGESTEVTGGLEPVR